MLMMGVQVEGLRKHPNGRVDQLEDRYLGMVEAPSSNLGVSTSMNLDAHLRGPRCHKFVRLFWQICWLRVSTLGIRKSLALLYHSENEPQSSTCKDVL